jgi:hypothetical protein
MRRLIHHPDASLLYEATTEGEGLNTAKSASPGTVVLVSKIGCDNF